VHLEYFAGKSKADSPKVPECNLMFRCMMPTHPTDEKLSRKALMQRLYWVRARLADQETHCISAFEGGLDNECGFLRSPPDLFATVTAQFGPWKNVNASLCRIFGHTELEMLALSFMEIVHPDDLQLTMAQTTKMADGAVTYFENRMRCKEGTYRRIAWETFFDQEEGLIYCAGCDITEAWLAAERLRQRTAVLEGIKEIFEKAHVCRVEEELGGLCLRVAEEVTLSRFGLIGELTSEGRMIDVAISNPGWEACRISDPVGHHAVPKGFVVHGIFGAVLRGGQSFYTNDPGAHPDSTGVPEGHPPLAAFLGVPLKHAGKIFGMVAVANRPGGYRDQDLEVLELLAPSIVHALSGFRSGKALREGEEQKRLALEIARLGTWTYNPLTRTLFWDKRSSAIFGQTSDEPCHIRDFIALVHPEDRTLVKKAMVDSETTGIMEMQYRAIRPDGEERLINAIARVYFDSEGIGRKPVWAVGTHMDLTEYKRAEEALRKSEEQLRLFIEHAPASLAMFDRHMRYLSVSRRWRTDYNLGDRNLIGMSHYDIFPSITESWKKVHQRGLAGEVVRAENDRFERSDGSVQWLRWEVRPWRDPTGDIAGIVIFTEDITARKQAEEALQELTATLDRKVLERTELANARTRQLQALAVELIEAEERERRRLAEFLHDDLQQMLAAARMQLRAIEDQGSDSTIENVGLLLEESMNKSRRLSHELSPAVLHHSGLGVALEWLIQHMQAHFDLHVQLEVDLVRQFESTPLKLFLFVAVKELLFNVVKHAGVRSARVAVWESEGILTITVSDRGKGFNPDILNDQPTKIGLGLLSLRERARYIGGSLVIESSPGEGSRFTLSVPSDLAALKPREHEFGVEHEVITQTVDANAGTLGGIRVLFADDHRVMRQGLIHLITGQPNIQVVGEAANGREAVQLASQLNPDVVIMDVSMPIMDGVEATRRIKESLPHVRVIGLSMFEEDQFSHAMKQAGAEAFISKNATSAELLKAIYG
jgi:PAS domain S-box-containing protein